MTEALAIVFCSLCGHRLKSGTGGQWIATHFILGVDSPCLPWDHRAVTASMAARDIAEVWRNCRE